MPATRGGAGSRTPHICGSKTPPDFAFAYGRSARLYRFLIAKPAKLKVAEMIENKRPGTVLIAKNPKIRVSAAASAVPRRAQLRRKQMAKNLAVTERLR